ncbi:MAG TPA: hypothetical protein ENI27_04710 [bacterium]|nr:hypothetical protein [bacterium]
MYKGIQLSDLMKKAVAKLLKIALMYKPILMTLSIITLFLFTSACNDESSKKILVLAEGSDVDPLFREFYYQQGGLETMGPAISPIFGYENVKYQYTVAGLMVFDPLVSANRRFDLAAIGLEMGISEPPVTPPDQPGVRYVNGHIIYPEFVPMYEKLGGARFVGRPITEAHYNPAEKRIEQYFENLGLYSLEEELPLAVHLLAYGVWKCNASCSQSDPSNDIVILPKNTDVRFLEAVRRLGTDFTGYALTEAYFALDGNLEQVFENVVMYSDSNHSGQVFFRPISERLGILPDPLVTPRDDPNFEFISIQGEKGFNIPKSFLDYMAYHGGMDVVGSPISELSQVKDMVYRQCYTNLCLEEHHNASRTLRIRPVPMGYTYRDLSASLVRTPDTLPGQLPEDQFEDLPETQPPIQSEIQPQVDDFSATQTLGPIGVLVWEIYPMVTPDQSQEIGVSVFENNLPLRMIEPELILWLPDGSQKTYYMFPTGDDGRTYMQLDPIEAASGTLIPYQVCIFNLRVAKFCVKDSFLIWVNP